MADNSNNNIQTKELIDIHLLEVFRQLADDRYVADNIAFKAMLQLVVTLLLPEWNSSTGPYAKGTLIRCQGRVFESKVDGNTAPPFVPIADGSGNILVDDNWNVVISDRVDEQNWAHLQDTNMLSLPQQIDSLQGELDKQSDRIAVIENFIKANVFVTA